MQLLVQELFVFQNLSTNIICEKIIKNLHEKVKKATKNTNTNRICTNYR